MAISTVKDWRFRAEQSGDDFSHRAELKKGFPQHCAVDAPVSVKGEPIRGFATEKNGNGDLIPLLHVDIHTSKRWFYIRAITGLGVLSKTEGLEPTH